ncbi:putative dTMP kinase [Helianthus annuus]|nr:putative dTMP kinase [Helianthus annuus]KAJ0486566.1 putative dTMP kinase [Helianthus annuus]KAJ0657132.1 putative dTMP kinase [Helianthus annuus]KAJ0660709.1 putative dTMP kinase [Helianthus annuus]
MSTFGPSTCPVCSLFFFSSKNSPATPFLLNLSRSERNRIRRQIQPRKKIQIFCFKSFLTHGVVNSHKWYAVFSLYLGFALSYFDFTRFRNFGALAAQRSSNLRFSYKCASRRVHMENNHHSDARGALIVLEGLDRSGKTSQSGRLVSYLNGLGHPVESWRFPDRDTAVGKMISAYLSNESQLDDHTIHLLFSANRWEKRSLMEATLKSGTSLIVDRYSYSGVAFSSAKGLDIEWCKAPEVGLLAPDLVVYLDIPPEKAAERGGYGGERYEKLEFQKNVAQYYKKLSDASWKIIDACQPMEDVEKQLKEIVLDCVKSCQNGKSVSQLWLS